MQILLLIDLMISGKHAPAGTVVTVDKNLALELIGINRATAELPAPEPAPKAKK